MPKDSFIVTVSHGKRTDTSLSVVARTQNNDKLVHLHKGEVIMTIAGLANEIETAVKKALRKV